LIFHDGQTFFVFPSRPGICRVGTATQDNLETPARCLETPARIAGSQITYDDGQTFFVFPSRPGICRVGTATQDNLETPARCLETPARIAGSQITYDDGQTFFVFPSRPGICRVGTATQDNLETPARIAGKHAPKFANFASLAITSCSSLSVKIAFRAERSVRLLPGVLLVPFIQ